MGQAWLFAGLMMLVLLSIVILSVAFTKSAADNLADWLTENGLTLLEQKRCSIWDTPFSLFGMNKNAKFYHLRAQTSDGTVRSGWVRVQGRGSLSAEPVSVKWEESPLPPSLSE